MNRRGSRRNAHAPPSKPQAVQPGDQPGGRLLGVAVVVALTAGLIAGYWPELRSWLRNQARVETQQLTSPPLAQVLDPASPYSDLPPFPRPAEPEPPANSKGALTEVPNLSSEGMEVDLGPGGQVLITSKYSIQRLGAGNPNDRQVLFTPRQYLAQFSGRQPQAMASALALPGERYLFGGWHGEVLLTEAGNLVRIAGDDPRPQGRIADMQVWRDRILVAGDGLWELTSKGRLQEIPLAGVRRIRAMAQGPGFLLLAAGRTIHAWDGQSTQRWFDLPDEGFLEMIAPAYDGGWWIGSTRGLYWTSLDAERTELVLPGVWTTAVAERPGELWVGTWKQGVLLRRGVRWYRIGADEEDLPVDSVSGLLLDPMDHAWITLYGGGAWHAPLGALREQMLGNPWTPREDPRESR